MCEDIEGDEKKKNFYQRQDSVGCRPDVDVPDGEEAIGYWVCWSGHTESCMVEACNRGLASNVLGEHISYDVQV